MSFGFSVYSSSMSPANSEFYFLLCLFFPSFIQLILEVLAKGIRRECAESSHLVLFLILQAVLSAFHDWVWCICHNGLYYVELCSFYTYFVDRFYDKWNLNFVKSFFCIYWDDVIFFLQFGNMVLPDWFVDIEPSLHLWDKIPLYQGLFF